MTVKSGSTNERGALVDPLAFLAGGSEMGAHIRAFDWAETPLGPIDQWPQSLKTAVRIMLTSRQPFWIGWGEQLHYLYNDPYKSIIGGKHPHALGQPTSVVWREIWEVIAPMLTTAMTGDEGTYVESQLLIMERHGYREETYYTFSYSPIPDDDGGVGGIICANTDDTQRVISERQLALLHALAAQTADTRTWKEVCARSAEALGSNPHDLPFAMIYLAEPDGTRLSLASVCGIERGHPAAPDAVALTEQTPWPFQHVMDTREVAVVDRLPEVIGAALPTGAWPEAPTRAALVPIAATGQTGRGGVLVVGLNPFRLFDDDYRNFLTLVGGQISARIASAQAYEEEKRRAEALAEVDRAKTAFFSNISHEFRTPLTLLLGPVQELLEQDDTELPAASREQLTFVHRNSLRLLKLVNTMLDFSRIEAGRMRATYQPVDLAAYTAELASTFRAAMEQAGLRFLIHCPPLPEPVYVDRDLWEKIVLNLLSNAFKFTLEGEVEVRLEERDGLACLTVRDTGVGIPPDELPHVFERFYRVSDSRGRTHEGTGIGLALVQELTGLHGGTVEAKSTVHRGSRFTVCVPLGTAHLDPQRLATTSTLKPMQADAEAFVQEALRWIPQTAHNGATDWSRDLHEAARTQRDEPPQKPRILWADDNADMREYVGRLLRARFEVEAVADGQAALEAIRANPPDLVLTDIMMPRLDGVGLLRALRADDALRTIPVILLSARAEEETRIDGMAAGADDYLIKPFSARELLVRIESHLQMAHMRAEMNQALRKSEEQVRMASAAARLGTYSRDLRTGEDYWSPEFMEIYGVRPGQPLALKDRIPAAVHPDDRERVLTQARARLQHTTDPRFSTEHRIIRPDGTIRWILVRGRVEFDALGEPTGTHGVVMDITERKRAEEALRESEQLYRQLVGLLPVALYTCQAPSGTISFYNEHAAALWGRAPRTGDTDQRFCGSFRLWLPDGTPLPHEETPMAAALREGHSFRNEDVIIERPDGSRVHVLANVDPIRDATGRIVGAINAFHDISALKQAEEVQARLAAIVEASDDAIVSKSLDGVIQSWNAGAERLFGYTAEEVVGKSIHLIIPEELWEEEEGILSRLRRGERIAHFETVRVTKEGRRLDISLTVSPITDEEGKVVGASKVARDVTARKQVEAALRASEERYRAIVESQAEMVCRFQPDGAILFVNGGYARASGTTPEALQGASFWSFIPEEEHASIRALLGQLRPESPEVKIENRFLTSDGPRWTFWTNRALAFDADGRATEVQSVGVDITERKQVEQALRDSEAKLSAILERLPVGVAVTDIEGRALSVNPFALRLFGFASLDEALAHFGRYRDVFELQLPNGRPISADRVPLTHALRGAYVHEREIHLYRHTDGAEKVVSFSAVPIMDGPDEPRRIVFVMHDVTERRRAEETLRESEARYRGLAVRLKALLNTTSRLIETLQTQELLGSLLNLSRELVTADALGVWRMDDQENWTVVASSGLSEEYIQEQIEATGKNLRLPTEPVVVQPTHLTDRSTPLLRYRWERYEREGIRSLLVLPLPVHGKPSGTLVFYCRSPHTFSEVEIESAQALANIAAAAITTSELYETLEERVEERTQQVRELASRLTMAEQEERRRISQILHDDLQQLLYGIEMKLGMVRQDLLRAQLPALAQVVEDTRTWIDRAVATTRQLTVDLSPPILQNEGLADALGWLQTQMKELHGLEITLDAAHSFYLPNEDLRVLLFQIVRELLFNIKKHAGVSRATVRLTEAPHLVIHVIDEGRGFDVEAVKAREEHDGGFGLFSVRERLRLLGGRLEVRSQPGSGTHIEVHAPTPPERPA